MMLWFRLEEDIGLNKCYFILKERAVITAADFMIFFLNKRTAIVCCYLELFGRYCAHTTLYKHSMTLLLITTPVTNDRNLSQ